MAEAKVDRSPTCPTCSRVFRNYQGRRVHERARYPSQFHAGEAVAHKAERRRARWDPGEIAMMADYEAANLRASNINLKIHQNVLPHRTIEGIKGARRSEAYKARVRSDAGPSSPPSALDPRGPATSPPLPSGRSTDHSDITSLGPVSGSPQPPPPHIMSEEGVHACMQQLSNAIGLSVPVKAIRPRASHVPVGPEGRNGPLHRPDWKEAELWFY
ncbi:hypothetical protein E2C01_029063 [Portunus trituberculatus]|uniref:Uncharacterized protein n=1 Tax=Portunus trituberculatus TaxID=210409 RepID=A0A5B7EQV7_PORTR|nr:hypothetical protein [Portunus trituberculatus]